jgi:hypothetical protein
MTVITASPKSFARLVELQQAQLDQVKSIRDLMADQASKGSADQLKAMVDAQQQMVDIQSQQLDQAKQAAADAQKARDDQTQAYKDIADLMKANKGVGESLKSFKLNIKDLFSGQNLAKNLLEGFNFKGIFDKKISKIDFVDRQKAMGSKDNDKVLAQNFENAMKISKQIKDNEEAIEKMKKRLGGNVSDEALRSLDSGKALLDKREGLAGDYAKYDLRTQLGKQGGGQTAAPNAGVGAGLLHQSSTDKLAEDSKSKEMAEEASNAAEVQTDLLTRIANATEKTAGTGGAAAAKPAASDDKSGGLGDLLGSMFDLLSSGFMKAIKFIFSPKNLLKAFTKVFAPAMIIGSLVSGLMDGFQAWKETGSIKEALIAGIGGILKFLSFGLFDADTLKSIIDNVSKFVNDWVIQPISDFMGSIGDVFKQYIADPISNVFQQIMDFASFLGDLFKEYVSDPIANAFQPIKDFFSNMIDGVMSTLKSIQIPGISFKLPFKDDPISIGPWTPFGDDNAKQQASADAPTTAKTVTDASKGNLDDKAKVDADNAKAGGGSKIITSQNTNNSNTTNVVSPPIRNQESSASRYIQSKYA